MPPSNLPSTLLDLVRLGVHEDGARAVRGGEANAGSKHVPAQDDCRSGPVAQTYSARRP